jgi:hypothetical protein
MCWATLTNPEVAATLRGAWARGDVAVQGVTEAADAIAGVTGGTIAANAAAPRSAASIEVARRTVGPDEAGGGLFEIAGAWAGALIDGVIVTEVKPAGPILARSVIGYKA